MHGVTPDIVTMAKGICNGLPMGAVITTPALAESLKEAYFYNTFGGNPVACAAGLAVLNVSCSKQYVINYVQFYKQAELLQIKSFHLTELIMIQDKMQTHAP